MLLDKLLTTLARHKWRNFGIKNSIKICPQRTAQTNLFYAKISQS